MKRYYTLLVNSGNDEVIIGVEGEGFQGEFSIEWVNVGTHDYVPKLNAFNDSWNVLFKYCNDLFQYLSDNDDESISCQDLMDELDRLGYETYVSGETKQKNYLNSGGNVCPNCNRNSVFQTGEPQINCNYVYCDITCESCDAEWIDVYTLTGFSNLEVP